MATRMLEQVRINRDRTVVLVPRRGEAVTTITFTNRAQTPILQATKRAVHDAAFASPHLRVALLPASRTTTWGRSARSCLADRRRYPHCDATGLEPDAPWLPLLRGTSSCCPS